MKIGRVGRPGLLETSRTLELIQVSEESTRVIKLKLDDTHKDPSSAPKQAAFSKVIQ